MDKPEAVVVDWHTGGSGCMVSLSWIKAAAELNSLQRDREALFGMLTSLSVFITLWLVTWISHLVAGTHKIKEESLS